MAAIKRNLVSERAGLLYIAAYLTAVAAASAFVPGIKFW